MNLKPSNWFFTQFCIIFCLMAVYVIMITNQWYYNMSIEESEENGLLAVIVNSENTESESYVRKYKNYGRLSSYDILIFMGYLFSLSYVFGLFLSNTRNAILVNIPLLILLTIKTISVYWYRSVYNVDIWHIIVWWLCVFTYLILFVIHNNSIVTVIDNKLEEYI